MFNFYSILNHKKYIECLGSENPDPAVESTGSIKLFPKAAFL